MVTIINSLSDVRGAELLLIFWAVCVILYLAVCFMIKHNRTKSGIRFTLIGLIIGATVIDLLWSFICYPHGDYVNRGIGGIYGLLLCVPILSITGVIVTAKNKFRQK